MKVTPFNWKHASEVYIYSAYNLHRIQIYIYKYRGDPLPVSGTQVLKSFFEKEGHTTVPKKFAVLPGSLIYDKDM